VRAWDQALDATVTPIRGQTTNTLANLPLRQPVEGFSSFAANTVETAGASWYNALGVSLNKRLSRGLQFLASYTWTSALETNPGYVSGLLDGGVLQGNQTDRSNYGFDSFIRPQRLVVSYLYDLPSPSNHFSAIGRILSGWSVAGVTTFQSGQRLTISESNELNAFGITGADQDRAQANCSRANLTTHGSVNSRLNDFFNASCFGAPPVIGADGLVTGFGNGGIGNVAGPAQQDFDISIIKKIPLGHNEARNLEFRAEFYNAFNTPSFALPPVLDAGSVCLVGLDCAPGTKGVVGFTPDPNFGVISTTNVAPRIVQFALKLYF
jgi:hypothetical protein